jgi:hypothetical protein
LCDGLDLDLNKRCRRRRGDRRLLRDRGPVGGGCHALASVAVDFRIAEAVDAVRMVYGMIPKKIFKQNPDYWSRR